jgi:hypothetical protein
MMADSPRDRRPPPYPKPRVAPALPYASAIPQPSAPLPPISRGKAMLQFTGGFFGGFAITFGYVAVIVFLSPRGGIGIVLLWLAFVLKIALGITLSCMRRWRFLGIGILVSIGVALLLLGAGAIYGAFIVGKIITQCKFN